MSMFEIYYKEIPEEDRRGLPHNLVIRIAVVEDALSVAKIVAEREGGDLHAIRKRLEDSLKKIGKQTEKEM